MAELTKKKRVYEMTVDEYIIHKSEWNKLHKIDEPLLTRKEAKSILAYRKKMNMYSKGYFQKNAKRLQSHTKNYKDRIKNEKIAAGLIPAPLTPEQKKERKEQKRKDELAKYKEKYAKNEDGLRDRVLNYNKEKWKDPDYKNKRIKYYSEWRRKKIEEIKKYKETDPMKYAEMYFRISEGSNKNFFESTRYKNLKAKLDLQAKTKMEKERQRLLKNPPKPYKPDFVKMVDHEKYQSSKTHIKKVEQFNEIKKMVDFEKLKKFV